MAQLRKIIDRHKKKINTQTPEIDKKKIGTLFWDNVSMQYIFNACNILWLF